MGMNCVLPVKIRYICRRSAEEEVAETRRLSRNGTREERKEKLPDSTARLIGEDT